ncbi:hypothetical protein AAII07_52560 [Microvirga sp. 0TCS3.31]
MPDLTTIGPLDHEALAAAFIEDLERPRRHGKAYLIATMVGLLNIAATFTTLLAGGPLI